MNDMLSDEDLTRLFEEAAAAYEVPGTGPAYVLEELSDAPTHPRLRRRALQLTGAAAAIAVAALLAQSLGTPFASDQKTTSTALAGKPAEGPTKSAPLPSRVPAGAAGDLTPAQSVPDALTRSRFATSQAGEAAGPAPDDTTRVVKTGVLTLAVDDGKVTPTLTRVRAVVTGARGYVADGTSQELGDHPSATVTFRVPVAAFDGVVEKVRAIGAKVVSAETSGKDVTATYADTEAQITSLKAARARFLTILAQAKTIGEILAVQQRVDEVQGRIDRLEGQRRVLADQSDLATLTVSVAEEQDQSVSTKPDSGLSKAWDDATHGFTSGVEGLIAHSGRTLLVLLVAIAAFYAARLSWRLARRRLV